MPRMKSNLEKIEDAYRVKIAELEAVEKLVAAKFTDKKGVFLNLIRDRKQFFEERLQHFNPHDSEVILDYAGSKEVNDEYRLLLDLLADPEKRAEKIKLELDALAKEAERLKNGGELRSEY